MSNCALERDFWPYCLDRVYGSSFVIRNRNYKPIALPDSKTPLDANRCIQFRFDALTPEMAASLSVHEDRDLNRIYFYDDATAPWLGKRFAKAYEKRILLLRECLDKDGKFSDDYLPN